MLEHLADKQETTTTMLKTQTQNHEVLAKLDETHHPLRPLENLNQLLKASVQ